MCVFTRSFGLPLLLAGVLAFTPSTPASATIVGTVQPPDSSSSVITVPATNTPSMHHVAGTNGGTRLNSNDSVVICAKDLTNESLATQPPCRSITNRSSKDYFVPWRTPAEWSSFISAVGEGGSGTGTLPGVTSFGPGSACLPKQNTSICGNIVLEHLGTRAAGFIEGDVLNYGAHGDVFGPLFASQILGDGTINYSITYVCDSGTWIKSHETGSCASMDGGCGENTSAGFLSNAQGWPLDTSVLCTAGSILNSLTPVYSSESPLEPGTTRSGSGGVLNGWTWVCSGTPGRQSAACSAPVAVTTPGRCSGLNGTTADSPPDITTLCAFGTTTAPTFSQSSTSWSWTCTGNNPKDPYNVATCSMRNARPLVNATCGSSANTVIQKLTTPPTYLCNTGSSYSEDKVNSLKDPTGAPGSWTWSCYGQNGGTSTNCSATYNPTANGSCSPTFNGVTFKTKQGAPAMSSANVPSSDNCKYCNMVSNMTSCPAPTNLGFNDSTSKWNWSCAGVGSGTSANCSATYNKDYSAPSCQSISGNVTGIWDSGLSRMNMRVNGVCGYPNAAISSKLCATGNQMASFYYNIPNKAWYWTCYSSDWAKSKGCSRTNPNPYIAGTCGAAGGVSSATPPAGDALCSAGTAGNVVRQGNNYSWICTGANGGATTTCNAPVLLPVNGACGTVNGTRIPNAPNQNLCFSGEAGDVYDSDGRGNGPWTWTCNGKYGGSNASCLAEQCFICSGAYKSHVSGNVAVTANKNGCHLSGRLSWQSPASILWSSSSRTISGRIAELLIPFEANKLSMPGAPIDLCPPCFLSPNNSIQGSITFTNATGSCSPEDQQLVGTEMNATDLSVR